MSLPIPGPVLQDAIEQIKTICKNSRGVSQFFPYGGSGYKASVTHYFESSTEVAACAVQPGSVEDLGSIVKVIAATGVPFAVKCGGHSTNPKFSSVGTDGIQIYLVRFNQIDVDVPNQLVRVGAGCLFEELYQALDPYNLNIVGGSGLAGVGVSGWMLGAGYSVKTSQHGLGVDNLTAVKLVLPSGEYTEVNKENDPNLFFAIKGGGNNFGIVTEFTLKAHHQGDFYDDTFTYKDKFDDVKAAIVKIIEKQDNQANIEATFGHYSEPGSVNPEVTLTVHCVYDGAYPSDDPFAELKKLRQGGHYKTSTSSFLLADLRRSYDKGTYNLLSELPFDLPQDRPKPSMVGISEFPRGRWGNVMVDQFTRGIIDEIEQQAKNAAERMTEHGGTGIATDLWPFTTAMFDHATDSAWPHVQGKPNCPIIVYFTWVGKEHDDYWIGIMEKTLTALREKVNKERPSSKDLPYFINTALAEATTVKEIYRDNLERLKQLRKKYDQKGVMDLTGGFRIPRE
ncbi:hypothetical protein J3R83DRAFT_4493 [Lanmaoa asiatica]|nr:hypothetical protein J3R83DRAFT_4493 [Lanmaoa asiatica]